MVSITELHECVGGRGRASGGNIVEGASAENFDEHVANKIQKYGYLLLSVTCSFS